MRGYGQGLVVKENTLVDQVILSANCMRPCQSTCWPQLLLTCIRQTWNPMHVAVGESYSLLASKIIY